MKPFSCVTTFAALALSLSTSVAIAQDYPQPTPAMQAIIDKDNGRHFGDSPENPGPLAKDLSPRLTPAAIDKAMRKVADWELARNAPYFDQIWTSAADYTGFLAAARATGDTKYRDAMLAVARKYNWQLRNRTPNADDQAIAQMYLELYLSEPAASRDQSWIAPTKADLASVIDLKTLTATDPRLPWWWCDALFMAPPVWARMYTATGDRSYITYLDTQFEKTSTLLYNQQEHLYARDANYITKTEPNGKLMFWSRGNGWVMAGIARILDYLPPDDPRRGFYTTQLREMATRVAELQGKDGLWHAGLLDPDYYKLPEISGSAFFTFAIAYGVNHHILDAHTFRPVLERAWRGILTHVYADGRLGCIQQTGSEPAFYRPSASYDYGIGAFLLAGSELKAMAGGAPISTPVVPIAQPASGQAQPAAQAPSPTDPAAHAALRLPVPANPALPTLFLVGDSTVRNGHGDGAQGQWGWGEPLVSFFDPAKINVVNRAIGGRSSRTYITEGHWADTLALMKPGDVVLFQFGHNDGGIPDEPTRARSSLPGVGDETREIENPILKKHERVYTFGHYMTQYVEDTKAKGATPIICSLIPRKNWQGGKIARNGNDYAGWAHQIADEEHVGFIDLNNLIADRYDALGEAAVEPLFADPHTHTSMAGAEMNAQAVVEGLKLLKNDPVAGDFSAKGAAVKP